MVVQQQQDQHQRPHPQLHLDGPRRPLERRRKKTRESDDEDLFLWGASSWTVRFRHWDYEALKSGSCCSPSTTTRRRGEWTNRPPFPEGVTGTMGVGWIPVKQWTRIQGNDGWVPFSQRRVPQVGSSSSPSSPSLCSSSFGFAWDGDGSTFVRAVVLWFRGIGPSRRLQRRPSPLDPERQCGWCVRLMWT